MTASFPPPRGAYKSERLFAPTPVIVLRPPASNTGLRLTSRRCNQCSRRDASRVRLFRAFFVPEPRRAYRAGGDLRPRAETYARLARRRCRRGEKRRHSGGHVRCSSGGRQVPRVRRAPVGQKSYPFVRGDKSFEEEDSG